MHDTCVGNIKRAGNHGPLHAEKKLVLLVKLQLVHAGENLIRRTFAMKLAPIKFPLMAS